MKHSRSMMRLEHGTCWSTSEHPNLSASRNCHSSGVVGRRNVYNTSSPSFSIVLIRKHLDGSSIPQVIITSGHQLLDSTNEMFPIDKHGTGSSRGLSHSAEREFPLPGNWLEAYIPRTVSCLNSSHCIKVIFSVKLLYVFCVKYQLSKLQ